MRSELGYEFEIEVTAEGTVKLEKDENVQLHQKH